MMWYQANKIPKAVYEAFVNLKKNSNFTTIVEWLETGQAEENGGFPFERDEVNLRVSQGRTQVINAILNAADKAEETVIKFK